jgi:putative DNA primase/helicase
LIKPLARYPWPESGIGGLAEGNSRLIFALSAAVAAPRLYVLDAESGGFHIVGASSIGKTTL